ncbi:MAG TPA: peptide-methionine (S)-S-oxide reductase MsrA [Gemmatimonadales bacterium]|nr:peptide-methionine (S)-S-oxide reductase MsrA [Gemmatimonadales bacterium]
MSAPREVATLAGGCFWCLEAVFERLTGVERVVSGYAGGHVPRPTYRQVCDGTTGHAEVVQVTFDPGVLPYADLLRIFFAFHDPTTKDRQGPDVGTQYRSAIFPHDAAQERTAREVIAELTAAGTFEAPIVTEVTPLPPAEVWPAEAYHQEYYRRNPTQPYCLFQVAPKVAKLRRDYAHVLRSP